MCVFLIIHHLNVHNKAMLVLIFYKCVQTLFVHHAWPEITDSHRAETEVRLQEKDAEIEMLQQELKSQRVHSL